MSFSGRKSVSLTDNGGSMSIQTPILEAKAKDILESERSGMKPNTIAASHIAAKHGFGLFNFLGGAGG